MKRKQWLAASLCFGALLLGLQFSPEVDRFVQHAREKNGTEWAADDVRTRSSLLSLRAWHDEGGERRARMLERIKAEAAKRNIPPVDAKIDRVWKAIPGYNGLEVDVEKSLELAEQQSFPETPQLVFREVPPQIDLDQLGPNPIYKGNPAKPMAALMINVAWGDEYLPRMLDVLRKEQVHATFFFDGMWLRKNILTARKIMGEGHEVSNHAYSHRDMSKLSRTQTAAEISKTETMLKQELGAQNRLFAPPSGDYNQMTVDVAHEMNLRTILWTIDTLDWKKPEPSSIVHKIATRIEPGSLILMHPTSSSSAALPGIIRAIRAKGLSLGTVSEVISPARVPEVESAGQ
ncbi:polysaccharide deacetylase family protein [Paenibacillus ehimensis]|uniref:Polysaccharide deacetylase family protein n=1 Tax=Paenibacillus ehimensis TaxID=79264 RepID=A0ABT8V4H1_9BACL|nr:polysaccharide deacetylase family protein [Paenibacillus ehimensis]MDO3676328.1 polysaccharide deacetylase family protein [Paenibacillus ehimensis]MEC0212290.1 polysaccharide deacetylase family protein [Paenibacillus ehimensis]